MTPARRALFSAPQPDYAVPPGETLRMRLEELDMSQADLARRTSLTTKHVNQLVKGVVTLSPDVAQRLAYATNVPLDWWLRLEADYQAAKLRLADNATTSAADNWVKTMPVTALVRAGVLPASPRDNPSRHKQLLQFFGVANINAYDAVWDRAAVAFRQSTAHTVSGGAVNSWLRLGELAAQTLDLPAFDPELFREALSRVGALTRRPIFEGIDAARSTFGSAGVGVLFIPEIAGARVYGASRWTTTGKNPLIQLSIRERTDDKMWLSLVHEAGHVLLHDRKLVFLEQDETHKMATAGAAGDVTEQEAERFAWQIFLPGVGRDELADVHSVEDVHEVADSVGVSASLVVCRLQSLGLWRFDQGNNLKHRVPAAAVGWRPPTTLTDRSTVRSARRADRRLPGAPS